MQTFLQILVVVGIIETIALIVGITWAIIMWAKGILPALWRLGNGLARRKIAVFASPENADSLTNLLTDSKLFSKKNTYKITQIKDTGAAEQASLYLVVWNDARGYIDEILRLKPDRQPLVVYAPRDGDSIPENDMKKLDGHRNTTVVNFRGRLLNDIVTALITTSYEKK